MTTPASTRSVYFWFAVWSGLCVACIYFCQPLLHLLARDFNVSDHEASLVATATQMGYGAGIFLLLPLGDFFDRRRLILTKLGLLFVAALACAAAPSLLLLLVASFAIGLFATTAQDVVPVAADLAPDARRAQYVGFVMTGLMLGILLSRTASGLIASTYGWRAVFLLGSGVILLCLMTCLRFFPDLPRRPKNAVLSIYASMVHIFRAHHALRMAVLRHGFLSMAFSGFWTCLSFYLSEPPFEWDASRVGLMGLAGAAGALSTSFVGRISDRRGPYFMIRIASLLALASFAAMAFAPGSVVVLIAGVVVFDLGVQSSLISHQAIIYALDPAARGRINGIFVSSIFIFFALGSYVSGLIWSRYHWFGLMMACSFCAVCAFLLARPRWPWSRA